MNTVTNLILIIVFVLLVFYVLRTLKTLNNYIKNYVILQKLPGPARVGMITGNLPSLGDTSEMVFQGCRQAAKQFYPVYKIYILHIIAVNIVSPEDCELILSNPIHNKKGTLYKQLLKWLKYGLLTSSGEKWQKRRKILTPAFHFSILQQFVSIFNDQAERLIEELEDNCDNTSVKVNSLIALFTLKTISETAMGTKLEFKNQKELNYKNAIHAIGQIYFYKLRNPWCMYEFGDILFSPFYFKERKVTRTLHKFTKTMIRNYEKNLTENELAQEHEVYKEKKRLAMLDLLLSTKKNENLIDDEGIQEEVDTFMFEGHDTVSVALSFILMLLANNKDAQERILCEMLEVLDDVSKKPTYNDLQNLKYMERCIKESLRLYPSVYAISRYLGQDLKITSGYLLPKDTHVIIHIYDVHRNPDIYPDPEKFDPDRFLPENSQNRHPYAYLPFSAGPRNCIGQKFAMLEMKVALCAILSRFLLEPVDTPETVKPLIDLVLRTKDEIRVKFVRRHI